MSARTRNRNRNRQRANNNQNRNNQLSTVQRPRADASPYARTTPPPRTPVGFGGRRAVKLKPEQLCDPMVESWTELMKDPFEAPSQGVYMPLHEDNFPCPVFSARNYATADIVGTTGQEVLIRCYPEAIELNDNIMQFKRATFAGVGPPSGFQGIILNSSLSDATGVSTGIAASYHTSTGANNLIQFTNNDTPIRYDAVTTPVINILESARTDIQCRTIAYGVRVSFISQLQNTEGWVEFIQPYEGGFGIGAAQSGFTANRRSPEYRRRFFSDHRTHTFVWSPNCDSIKMADFDTNAPTTDSTFSRMYLRLGGLSTGDIIMTEIVCNQEYTGRSFQGFTTNTHVTPEAIHVSNALATYHGQGNADRTANGKLTRVKSMAHEIAAHKLSSHPLASRILHQIVGMGEGALAGRSLLQIAKSALPKIGSLIAEGGEMAVPLLAAL